ncbi:alpha/beta-hydrolase family protein [Nonomuraea sp. NPDC046570]|uniref:alpha/beta hydrolase n=1 Tax=Nonomuraea sp. NPDC046570 TaxID=3155255 RepID=UPI003408EBB9
MVVRRGLGFGGTLVAVLFFCAALTPSLLPRTWQMQGVIGGITAALGYAVGATLAAALPARWQVRNRRAAWQLLIAMCAPLTAAALLYSIGWQRDLRRLMGMDTAISWSAPVILIVAAAVFAALLLFARTIRLGGRKLVHWLDRFIPVPVAHALGVLIVAALVAVFANSVLFNGFINVMNDISSVTNRTTATGIRRPVSPHVSGGPGSLVPWHSLGKEGRSFVATASGREELAAFAGPGVTVAEPIRVYVGLHSSTSPREQAALAVRELERTGAFGRPVLAVLGTTGTGWVDPAIADSLELMYRGDSAVVALQYSYLPSWVSFLVDRGKAAATGAALIEAVRARYATLPADGRPRLLVSGESLGSYELEGAFEDLADLLAEVDGAMLVGPPDANPIWQEVTAAREPGSPVWRPVYQDGRTVRFAQYPADLRARPGRLRVVYLQNASDPVVWWSPTLVYDKPEWLTGERGPDVNDQMNWFPLVTFWQVLGDLPGAITVPAGHGHHYGAIIADGWAAIAAPPGWTAADTTRLGSYLATSSATHSTW